jgi:transcriptional regulator with XRE-family HTH domain
MDLHERIQEILEYSKLSDRAFALKCGLKQITFSAQIRKKRSISIDTVQAVCTQFPEFSRDWVLLGEGKPFKCESEGNERIGCLSQDINSIQDTTSLRCKIRHIITYYNMSERQFSIKIGVNPTVINSMFKKENEPSAKVIQLIAIAFPEISLDWFIRNKGDMFGGSNKDIELIKSSAATLQDALASLTKRLSECDGECR